MANNDVPEDLLPDDLKPVEQKAKASVPQDVPEDLLPDELKAEPEPMAPAGRMGKLAGFAAQAFAKPTKRIGLMYQETPSSVFAVDEKSAKQDEALAKLEPGLQAQLAGRFIAAQKPGFVSEDIAKQEAARKEAEHFGRVSEPAFGLPHPEEELARKEAAKKLEPAARKGVQDIVSAAFGRPVSEAELADIELGERRATRAERIKAAEEEAARPEREARRDEEARMAENIAAVQRGFSPVGMPVPTTKPLPTTYKEGERASFGPLGWHGIASGALRGALGDTKLVRSFEEGGALGDLGIPPDPDAPRPKERPLIEDPARLSVERAKQWDRYRANKDEQEQARMYWRPIKALREKQGRPQSAEALPNIVDLKGSVFDNLIDDPNGPFSSFDKAYASVMGAPHPETNPLIKRLVSGNLMPERFQETFKSMEEERKKYRARGSGSFFGNVRRDLADTVMSVAELGNELLGITRLEPGETPEEHGQKTGYGLGMMPAQAGALLLGLGDFNGKNSMLTHPFSTVLIGVEPALGVAEKAGLGRGVARVNAGIAKLAEPLIDRAAQVTLGEKNIRSVIRTKENAAEFVASLRRKMGEGLAQRDPRIAAILDAMLYKPEMVRERMKAIAEPIARQIGKGQVEFAPTEVEPVDLTMTPAADVRAAESAQRAAEAAGEVAGKAAGRADMLRALRQKMSEDSRTVRDLKRQAEGLQKKVRSAAEESDLIRVIDKLNKARFDLKVAEARLAAETRESRFRGRAEKIAEEAGEAGIELAEEMTSVDNLPKKVGKASALMTEKMKTELSDLGFTPESIEELKPEEAGEIIKSGTLFSDYRPGKGIGRNDRIQLEDLGYSEDSVDMLRPSQVKDILSNQIRAEDYVPPSRAPTSMESLDQTIREAKELAKKTDREIMRGLAEAERLHAAADEARQRGIREEDVIRERAERIRATLEERQRARAGKAAVEGVKLAEQVKQMDEETAAGMAQEAAAAQSRAAAGAERSAQAAARRAEVAGVRPEVEVGPVYVAPGRAAIGRLSEAELRTQLERAPDMATKDAIRAELEARIAGREGPQVSQQELRKTAERRIAESDQLQELAKTRGDVALKETQRFAKEEPALREKAEKSADPQERAAAQAELDSRAARTEQLATQWWQAMEDADSALKEALKAHEAHRRTLEPGLEGVRREVRVIDPRAEQYLDRLLDEAKAQANEVSAAFDAAPDSMREKFQALVDAANERVAKVEKAIAEGQRGAYRIFDEEMYRVPEEEFKKELSNRLKPGEEVVLQISPERQVKATMGKDGRVRIAEFERGQPQTMAQAFEELPKHRRLQIEEMNRLTSDAKKAALDAGFDPNKRIDISQELADSLDLSRNPTIYEFARRYTEYAMNRNVSELPSVVQAMLERRGSAKGAAEAAKWLDLEVQTYNATRYMLEPQYGRVPRPASVETTYRVSPEGKLEEMPRTYELRRERVAKEKGAMPLGPGEAVPEYTPPGERSIQLEEEMVNRRIPREEPVPFRTTNPLVEKGIREIYEEMRPMAYEMPSREAGYEAATTPIREDLSKPVAFTPVAEADVIKALTPERLAMRITQALLDDTVQLLRDREYRNKILQRFRKNAEKAGLSEKLINESVIEFRKKIEDPALLTTHGKNEFRVFEGPNGEKLWTRDDFAKAAKEISPQTINSAQARVAREVIDAHAEQARLRGIKQAVADENSRLFRNPDGSLKMVKDAEGREIPAIKNVTDYANEVFKDVVKGGAVRPVFMPYKPELVAAELRSLAKQNPKYARKLEMLADLMEDRMVKAAKEHRLDTAYRDGALQSSFDKMYGQVFQKTQEPPELHNLYVDRGFADSMIAHLTMLHDGATANTAFRVFHELSKYAKRSVVANNLRALVNNDLSNMLGQMFRRADPSMLFDIVNEPIKFKYYLDGDHAKLKPEEVRMFKSINETGVLNSGEISKDIGQTQLWKTINEAMGTKAQKLTDINAVARSKGTDLAAPFEGYGKLQDALAEGYQKLGDVPGRIEEMVHVWKLDDTKTRMLKPGEDNIFSISPYRQVKMTMMPDNRVRITEVSGARERMRTGEGVEGKTYGLDSPEVARIYAEHAAYVQEKIFYDYGRVGTWAKYLRSSYFAPLSGIFSWFFKAMDIPGIKKGYISELFNGNPVIESTSRAVQEMQANDRILLSVRRAAMTSAATAAFKNQRELREVRRAGGYNPLVESVILAKSTDPAYAYARDDAPLLFTQPSSNVLGAVQAMLNYFEFRPLKDDPQAMLALMRSNQWSKYTPKDWESTEKRLNYLRMKIDEAKSIPAREEAQALFDSEKRLYDEGQRMLRLKKEDPAYYDAMQSTRDDFLRYMSDEVVSKEQLAQVFGAAGGPLIKWWEDVVSNDNQRRWPQLRSNFFTLVLGATPWAVVDTALATVGNEESSYYRSMARQGFAGAGGGQVLDESSGLQWGIRNLFSVGWSRVAFENTDSIDSAKEVKGRLEKRTDLIAKNLTNSLIKEDERSKATVQDESKSEAERREAQRKIDMSNQIKEAIKQVQEETLENIRHDYEAWKRNEKDYPVPSKKP